MVEIQYNDNLVENPDHFKRFLPFLLSLPPDFLFVLCFFIVQAVYLFLNVDISMVVLHPRSIGSGILYTSDSREREGESVCKGKGTIR